MTSVQVREQLVSALRLDLIGPGRGVGTDVEVLPQDPSRWYLTGFLVPLEGDDRQRSDPTAPEDLEAATDGGSADDATAEDKAAARKAYLPSSIGLSLLVTASTKSLTATVRWGDYKRTKVPAKPGEGAEWTRTPREVAMSVPLPAGDQKPTESPVPGSNGLNVAVSVRSVPTDGAAGTLAAGTRSVSVFLVNRRKPAPDEVRDQASVFQAELEVTADVPLVARPNLRSLGSDDWDERVADLQYRDACEFAVGHNVSAAAELDKDGCTCRTVRTTWVPRAEVERVAPADLKGITTSMDALSALTDGADAKAQLGELVTQYRAWLDTQASTVPAEPAKRRETANELLNRAKVAAGRIDAGIALLADPVCLTAFKIANGAMAIAARRRLGVMAGKDPATVKPAWRPFQLAFLLMNLPGIAQPTSHDREVVDLLFFPTGGGKTEAYLGLAAFTLVLRRLRDPSIGSAGLSVLMRYTLRLLTLDQLSRAATLVCALELERLEHVDQLGPWPFEIGLWVGKAATPNKMGAVGDGDAESARSRTIAHHTGKPAPVPLEECPWCGWKFDKTSFQLIPNEKHPTDLRLGCKNRHCEFSRRMLPLLTVDEPIYRRLPCFMIATVDKFAAMPWTGEVGGFFGRVQRHDKDGFYGPCDLGRGRPLPKDRLPPPDLVIQDELHLISGPLGTMVGLYESALDELCIVEVDGKQVRPKIVASTATVRRAETQIQALFNRPVVDIFPPPGPDRRNSFFAETDSNPDHGRLYIGLAAQGRSPKVVMLRTYLALLAAAQKIYTRLKKAGDPTAADAYMTLLGYFNALRELGGARRVIEDEVGNRLAGYGRRARVGETDPSFENRKIAYEVVELTSRVSTDKVAEAKRRLAVPFTEAKDRVDVAIATNMISVGLDITRLGLMVVYGQPKSSAEYIQATSRVGRSLDRPGLVVTILNVHKPRDRSHYERFTAFHESFYRGVEATSVTPFSPRALDRGLAGTLVAMARQGDAVMTPALGAGEILAERPRLAYVIAALAERARAHTKGDAAEAERYRKRTHDRSQDLLEEWSKIALEFRDRNTNLQYQQGEAGGARPLLYAFLDPELKSLPARHQKFRANRSLRDVEPSVNLWLKTIDGVDVVEGDA